MLIPKLFKWRKDQKEFMESLPGKDSEHIRAAIDDYIAKKKQEQSNAATSPSKLVKGGEDGREQSDTNVQPLATQ